MVKTAYQIAVGQWGIQPDGFWQMDVEEWFWLYAAKRPRDPKTDYAGQLTEEDCEDLYGLLH